MPIKLVNFVAALLIAVLLGVAMDSAAPARAQEADTASESEPSNIEKRLRRIEDNIIDMRAMIGALQSFAPGDGTENPSDQMSSNALSGGDPFDEPAEDDPFSAPPQSEAPAATAQPGPELRQLEIQVQALSAQLSETVKRLNRLESAMGQQMDGSADISGAPGTTDDDMAAMDMPDEDMDTGFGTTTVQSPSEPDDMSDTQTAWPEDDVDAEAMAAAEPESQALFTQAYDAFQAQDYAAARDGFQTFLDTYPDDPLANNARYWLADAAFAEGDYVTAANNFVKVYNTAPSGEKSEDTLLKLAIVLRRLERPQSACDALSRLDGRLDNKPESFRERVSDERNRSGCG